MADIDIVRRLRDDTRSAAHCAMSEDAADEIERLSDLVRSAFNEGFRQGMREVASSKGGYSWNDSKAKAALAGASAFTPAK